MHTDRGFITLIPLSFSFLFSIPTQTERQNDSTAPQIEKGIWIAEKKKRGGEKERESERERKKRRMREMVYLSSF